LGKIGFPEEGVWKKNNSGLGKPYGDTFRRSKGAGSRDIPQFLQGSLPMKIGRLVRGESDNTQGRNGSWCPPIFWVKQAAPFASEKQSGRSHKPGRY